MNERERTTPESAVANADLTAEEFAASTPAVPADRIRCTECSTEYIGDPDNGTICPDCRDEMGIEVR